MILLNGEIVPREEGKIDIEDRGFQFGDGIYEVIRVYNGKMFAVQDHIDRLLQSAKKLHIPFVTETKEFVLQLKKLININNLTEGIVYIQVTRGTSIRTHAFPPIHTPITVVAYTAELNRPMEPLKTGGRCILTEDIRWLRCDIKSVNLLGNVLAKQEAAEKGCIEAILHRGNTITEGSSSNVFIVKNGVIQTHPANQFILNGITRKRIQNICHKHLIPFVEQSFTTEELFRADEVFIASTTSEVMPIIEIDHQSINGSVPGPVTKKLQSLFLQGIEMECGAIKA